MKCSQCGKEESFNTSAWKKLEEVNHLPYTVWDASYTPNYYWTFCPECYKEKFEGCLRYQDIKETKRIEEVFAASVVDPVSTEETVPINISTKDLSGFDVIVKDKTMKMSRLSV